MDDSNAILPDSTHPNLTDRLAALLAWGVAAALFSTIGWLALAPTDPLGAVSLLTMRSSMLGWLQAIGLAAVVGGVASLLSGRRIPDIGPLAASLGLTLLSLRGGTAEYFLLHGGNPATHTQRDVAGRFVLDSIGWFLVLLVATLVSAAVLRWCFNEPQAAPRLQANRHVPPLPPLAAGFDLFRGSSPLFGIDRASLTPPLEGLKHSLIAVGVSVAAFGLLSTGLVARSIQHGQACFVVAAAVYLGVYAAQRLVPVRSAMWGILSVGLVALIGYGWSALRPVNAMLPTAIPASCFMRILPIQLIGVGTAAAIMAFGYTQEPDVAVPDSHNTARR